MRKAISYIMLAVLLLLGIVVWHRNTVMSRPEIPVDAAFRQAIIGQGYVLHLKNRTDEELPLKIKATSAAFGKTKTFEVIASGANTLKGGVVEIGSREGFAFTKGDSVEIDSRPEFKPSVYIFR